MTYPPEPIYDTEYFDPAYQDEAAAALYGVCGGSKLVGALARLHQSLTSQSAKLEEYYNTPYTEDTARVMKTTMETIERVEAQIERWHYLIYPNQRLEMRMKLSGD